MRNYREERTKDDHVPLAFKKSQKETAALMGLSAATVREIEKRALQKIAAVLVRDRPDLAGLVNVRHSRRK